MFTAFYIAHDTYCLSLPVIPDPGKDCLLAFFGESSLTTPRLIYRVCHHSVQCDPVGRDWLNQVSGFLAYTLSDSCQGLSYRDQIMG